MDPLGFGGGEGGNNTTGSFQSLLPALSRDNLFISTNSQSVFPHCYTSGGFDISSFHNIPVTCTTINTNLPRVSLPNTSTNMAAPDVSLVASRLPNPLFATNRFVSQGIPPKQAANILMPPPIFSVPTQYLSGNQTSGQLTPNLAVDNGFANLLQTTNTQHDLPRMPTDNLTAMMANIPKISLGHMTSKPSAQALPSINSIMTTTNPRLDMPTNGPVTQPVISHNSLISDLKGCVQDLDKDKLFVYHDKLTGKDIIMPISTTDSGQGTFAILNRPQSANITGSNSSVLENSPAQINVSQFLNIPQKYDSKFSSFMVSGQPSDVTSQAPLPSVETLQSLISERIATNASSCDKSNTFTASLVGTGIGRGAAGVTAASAIQNIYENLEPISDGDTQDGSGVEPSEVESGEPVRYEDISDEDSSVQRRTEELTNTKPQNQSSIGYDVSPSRQGALAAGCITGQATLPWSEDCNVIMFQQAESVNSKTIPTMSSSTSQPEQTDLVLTESAEHLDNGGDGEQVDAVCSSGQKTALASTGYSVNISLPVYNSTAKDLNDNVCQSHDTTDTKNSDGESDIDDSEVDESDSDREEDAVDTATEPNDKTTETDSTCDTSNLPSTTSGVKRCISQITLANIQKLLETAGKKTGNQEGGETPGSFVERADVSVHIDEAQIVVTNGRRQWKCLQCPKVYGSKHNLVTHILDHSGIKPHQCRRCGKAFKQPSHLQTHLLTHSSVKPHMCTICERGFTQASHVKRHMAVHMERRPNICDICHRGFAYPSELRSHMEKHKNGKKNFCEECHQEFDTLKKLKQHRQTAHRDVSDLTCKACGRVFIFPSQLRDHMIKHEGRRPYICSECGMDFMKEHHLKAHHFIHSGARPWVCPICQRPFNQKANMQRHLLVHETEKRYKCSVCERAFSQAQILKAHMVTHADKKPYSCTICGKQFSRQHNLNGHMLMHDGAKPYTCFCGASFTLKGNLNRHKKEKHKLDTSTEYSEEEAAKILNEMSSKQRSVDDAAETSGGETTTPKKKRKTQTPRKTVKQESTNEEDEEIRAAWQGQELEDHLEEDSLASVENEPATLPDSVENDPVTSLPVSEANETVTSFPLLSIPVAVSVSVETDVTTPLVDNTVSVGASIMVETETMTQPLPAISTVLEPNKTFSGSSRKKSNKFPARGATKRKQKAVAKATTETEDTDEVIAEWQGDEVVKPVVNQNEALSTLTGLTSLPLEETSTQSSVTQSKPALCSSILTNGGQASANASESSSGLVYKSNGTRRKRKKVSYINDNYDLDSEADDAELTSPSVGEDPEWVNTNRKSSKRRRRNKADQGVRMWNLEDVSMGGGSAKTKPELNKNIVTSSGAQLPNDTSEAVNSQSKRTVLSKRKTMRIEQH